jgi:2-polyprenyl-3-methyl-5-hydroxy-6-metoxy-1,4-benzoquinol methylase
MAFAIQTVRKRNAREDRQLPVDAVAALPREMAMPGVHRAAQRLLETLPRGSFADLGAGQGALSAWADNHGFDTTAIDFNRGNFVADSIEFIQANLNQPLPLADATFETVAAIEVIEHLENSFALLREMYRILKPGGYAVLSTPNESSLAARWTYMSCGFYSDASYVMRVPQSGEFYNPHVNCVPLPTLEYAWRRAGFQLERFEVSRVRPEAWLLCPFLAPLQWLKLAFRRQKPQHADRVTVQAVHRLMNDPRVLTGRILVFLLKKPLQDGHPS